MSKNLKPLKEGNFRKSYSKMIASENLPSTEKFFEIEEVVKSEFQLEDSYIMHGIPTFIIKPCETKHRFLRLIRKLDEKGFIAFLRKKGKELTIQVFLKPERKPFKIRYNILLFVLTMLTISYAGWIWSNHYVNQLMLLGITPSFSKEIMSLIFAACLLTIAGLHEFAHKIAATWNKVEASMPYFIPFPPPLGTFGALIIQRGFPVNRDQLFDIGFSGPIAGFIATVFLTILGVQLSEAIPPSPELRPLGIPEIPPLLALSIHLRKVPPGLALMYGHPVLVVAHVGAMITLLQLIPAFQLDGGHMARAIFGSKGHEILSLVGILVLTFTNWWSMAIFLLVLFALSGGKFHPGPLDDVSPLSTKRKILSIIALGLLLLCFSQPPFFWTS